MRKAATRLITTKQAAELLGCSERRIRQLLDMGTIRGIRPSRNLWLIDEKSLLPYLDPRPRGRPRSRHISK